jgi:SAM-dependent methyltransferase
MKTVPLVLIAGMFLLDQQFAQAQWSRGGSSAGGWGGSAGRSQWGATAGQNNSGLQSPASPGQASATTQQPTVIIRQAPANVQQPRSGSVPAQPQMQVIPGRAGVNQQTSQNALVNSSPALGSRWLAPTHPIAVPPHWRRDRFFRHRHPHEVFFGAPGFFGTTTVITEVAPGVIQEEPRYLDESEPGARTREPGQLAPFDPTPQEVVERMLALARIGKNDVIYDLGSGDGRLLITAAKKYGARGVGFEIEPGLVKLARENVRREGVNKLVEIRQQDFLGADLSPASVVTLYLSYDGNLAVRPQLMQQLKRGARVVSYAFDMGEWQPKIAENFRDSEGNTHQLFVWQIGEPMVFTDAGPILRPQPNRAGPLIIEVR